MKDDNLAQALKLGYLIMQEKEPYKALDPEIMNSVAKLLLQFATPETIDRMLRERGSACYNP